MEKLNFIELIDSHEAITREEFSNRQEKRRGLVEEKIQSLARQNRENFREGIKNVLTELKEKFTNNNDNEDATKQKDENDQNRVEVK